MQLFLTLNDFAGRYPFLDAFMRGVYVATIPLLAVVLLGLIILSPRAPGAPPGTPSDAPSHGKIAFAALLALGGAALLAWGVEALAQSLDLGTISPRPFMTRWVNLLIVEPQDNSFPCIEVMVAAILSVGIWAAHVRWGMGAAFLTLMLMTARLFCGSNYGADVIVGAIVGVGLMWLCLAICRAPRSGKARILTGSAGVMVLASTALGTFTVMAGMPRFAGKLQVPWGIAAPGAQVGKDATRAARGTLQEGEGVPSLDMEPGGAISADQYAGEAEAQAMDKRSTLFLPATEAYLRRVLTPRALPFTLLDVEVAPVTFQESSYRAAAIRFEIDPALPGARNLVAQRAATLVKGAFAADPKLDNVDITGVVTGDVAAREHSLMNFAGDEVPVFTASVQRRNLIVSAPKWANDPKLEGGLWLRTRSRLWINDQVLPRLLAPTPAPKPKAAIPPQPQATPQPTATATPKIAPAATPTIAPTAAANVPAPPAVIAPFIPRAKVTPKLTPTAKPATKPTVRPTTKPTARPRLRVRPRLRSQLRRHSQKISDTFAR